MNEFFLNIYAKLHEIFNPATVGTRFVQLLSKLIVFAVVMFAFYIAWLVCRGAVRTAIGKSRIDETNSAFIHTLVKSGLFTVGAVTALESVGIRMSAVLASLGIAGLSIGFAARDSLSNVISGVLIFLDRPFVIGDLVEVEDVYGTVDRVTLRSTRIVTPDGKMMAVPNSVVINKTVTSYTNFPHLRLDIPIAVAVTEDLERVRSLLLDLVNGNPVYREFPPPRVVVTNLNDYNVVLELQVWLDDERDHIAQRFQLRERMFDTLTRAGVTMPFETISITPIGLKTVNENGKQHR